MSTLKRTAFAVVLAIILMLAIALPAQAVTFQGSDAQHREMSRQVVTYKPGLLAFVESVYPAFYVRISTPPAMAGHAWAGYIECDGGRSFPAFTYQVAHEFAHEVQLAADNSGRHLDGKWLDLLRSRGYTDEQWTWSTRGDLAKYNPWECFAENMARAYWSPYYTGRATPNTLLVWLSRAEMTSFLASCGITP